MTKTKEAILHCMFLFGGILNNDLQKVLKTYSKNPKKYIQKLRESEDLELEKKTNLLHLSKSTKKQISNKYPLWKFKNNQITNHDLISFELLFYFLTNHEVKMVEIEQAINNTSLRSDLVVKLSTNTYYIESDNGTERQKEIESKINQYKLNLKGVLIFVSNSVNNIKTAQNIAIEDQRIIILHSDLIQDLHSRLISGNELYYTKENQRPNLISKKYDSDSDLMKLVLGFEQI